MFAIEIADKLLTLCGSHVFLTLWTKIELDGKKGFDLIAVVIYVIVHCIAFLL